MSLSQRISSLIIILEEAKLDADKLESGKRGANPAGTRVRQKAQIVARELGAIRKAVIQIKKDAASEKGNADSATA